MLLKYTGVEKGTRRVAVVGSDSSNSEGPGQKKFGGKFRLGWQGIGKKRKQL